MIETEAGNTSLAVCPQRATLMRSLLCPLAYGSLLDDPSSPGAGDQAAYSLEKVTVASREGLPAQPLTGAAESSCLPQGESCTLGHFSTPAPAGQTQEQKASGPSPLQSHPFLSCLPPLSSSPPCSVSVLYRTHTRTNQYPLTCV